jgi:riboflavin biosynthesis pyrimidine reductase
MPVQLTTLFERPGSPAFDLPPELLRAYGGGIGFDGQAVYANFVTTLDGVVAFGDDTPPSVISGKSEADRFVMGLLRACADAVVIGAGTLRTEPGHLWTAEHIYPPLAEEYRGLRVALGLPAAPRLVVLTRSGKVDRSARAFERGALVLTTPSAATTLRRRLPKATVVRSVVSGRIEPAEVLSTLRRDGHGTILTEGGPSVMGSFVRSRALDELFLTVSPRIAGRSRALPRLGLVQGMAFSPDELLETTLLSAKRQGSHLFLRYRLGVENGAATG